MKHHRWIWILLSVILFLTAGGIAVMNGIRDNRPKPYLTVNDQEVFENEIMIYYRLMQLQFEHTGGDEIWNLNMLGFDSEQTAVDRVFASIIRIKVAQSIAGTVKSQEYSEILKRSDQLEEILGKDYMDQYGIDRELIEKVVSENYLVYRYEQNAAFRSSDFEEQIEQLVEDRYGLYDETDQEEYLKNATIRPLMFYTGEYAEGEWVSYPESQKEQIRERAMEVFESLDAQNFYIVTMAFSDSIGVLDNPVFNQGAVVSPRGSGGNVFKGQVLPEVAEEIFATPLGTLTPVMTTDYGYLVCMVTFIADPFESDRSAYHNQLQLARNSFREQAIDVLKQQRLEEEWERLETESVIEIRKEAFMELLKNESK